MLHQAYRVLDPSRVLEFPLTGVRLIEASAGTGKTYTIANLYVRHILAGRQVSEILVVTFTRAATEELRGRIRARLFETLDLLERPRPAEEPFLAALVRQLAATDGLDLAARRLRLAVRAMDEAVVFSIHGFCQRALGEFAFHSRQGFQLDVLDDDQALWQQAVRDWWRKTLYPCNRAQAEWLLDSLGDLSTFYRQVRILSGPQKKRLLPPPSGRVEQVLARCARLIPEFESLALCWSGQEGQRIRELLRTSKGLKRAKETAYHPDRLEPALATLDSWFETGGRLPPPAFQVLTASSIEPQRAKRTPDSRLEEAFFAHCDWLWKEIQARQQELRVAAFEAALDFARAQVRADKQARQQLSFDDLLTELRDALESPSGGEAFATVLRQRFPVAMIDEFQDTDPVQYAIFRRLYQNQPETGLILIGDPKQAIYSFRGGDIFTYIQAKRELAPDSLYTLETNWRSTPEIVAAVNALFQYRGQDAFVYAEDIPFRPARPADKPHRPLTRDGQHQPAIRLWTLPESAKPWSKEAARERIHAAVAGEIARLIEEGRQGRARLGDRPLRPRDIAVLVRRHRDAASLRQVLAGLGVRAVAAGRAGVFGTDEAAALDILLQAVLSPQDPGVTRQALASPLLGKTVAEIERILNDEDDWTAWTESLRQLRALWQRRGFMPMFQQLLKTLEIAPALSREAFAERRLTDLLHLGELLQQASKTQTGLDALLAWYRRQCQEEAGREETAAPEAAQLRLESDAELVQLVTIHASKGLEYPVVFLPHPWDCSILAKAKTVHFHRHDGLCMDLGSDDLDRHRRLAEQERLAEDVRLLYVALTRAESALYLAWGRIGKPSDGHAGRTALGYLLYPRQKGDQLAAEFPDAFVGLSSLQPELDRLATATGGQMRPASLLTAADAGILEPDHQVSELARRAFRGSIAGDWRIASFSSLTRDRHPDPPAGPKAPEEDDIALRFPTGLQVGSYLHQLLQRLDFRCEVRAQVRHHSERLAPRFALDHQRWGEDAAHILERVTLTPLNAAGLRLADLEPARHRTEMEFDFSTGPVDMAALNRLLQQQAGETLPPLETERFRGLVNGLIDLVFEWDGRFYLADYKSHFLGPRLADYDPPALRAAMLRYRYDLQYLLYSLALHRYLGQRRRGYDYDTEFGGVFYLFLRAMRPENGPRFGIYHVRPSWETLLALDTRIFSPG